ncbi:MAG: hypothetical protein V4492_05800 [Chlamydiota bacterium]
MAATSFRTDNIPTQRPMYDADVAHLLEAVSENPGAAAFVEVATKAVDIPGLARAIVGAPGQNTMIITHKDAPPAPHTQRRLFSEASGWKAVTPQVESFQEGVQTQIYVVPLGLAQKSIQYKMGDMTFGQPPILEPGPNQQAHLVSPLTFVDRGAISQEVQNPSMDELSRAHPEHASLLRTAHSMLENPSIEGHLIHTLGKVITFFARIEGIEPASFQCRMVGAISADGVAPRNFWSFEEGIEPLRHPLLDHTRIRDLRLLSVQSVRVDFPPSLNRETRQPPRSPSKPPAGAFVLTSEDLQRTRVRQGGEPSSSTSLDAHRSITGFQLPPHHGHHDASQSFSPGYQGTHGQAGQDPNQSCAHQ